MYARKFRTLPVRNVLRRCTNCSPGPYGSADGGQYPYRPGDVGAASGSGEGGNDKRRGRCASVSQNISFRARDVGHKPYNFTPCGGGGCTRTGRRDGSLISRDPEHPDRRNGKSENHPPCANGVKRRNVPTFYNNDIYQKARVRAVRVCA